jgi:hypothetical protein
MPPSAKSAERTPSAAIIRISKPPILKLPTQELASALFRTRFKNCESQLRLTGAFTAEPESETLMKHQSVEIKTLLLINMPNVPCRILGFVRASKDTPRSSIEA